MEEYLNILLEQIQCRQAREIVREEIRNHILDQAKANERDGMEKKEAVAARVIQVSFGQGNPLGMIMGSGCALFFEIVTVIDILHFFGRIPSTRLFLPFFSPGGGGIAVAYVLAGIVLSVYRYQNIKSSLRTDYS
jgi:Bacterial cell division membrane protein